MPSPHWLTFGFAIPALIGAVLMLLIVWPWRTGAGVRAGIAWAAAPAAGFAWGFIHTNGWPRINRLESTESQDLLLVVLVPAVMIVAALSSLAKVPAWLTWALRWLLCAGTAPLLLQPELHGVWTATEATGWIILLTGLLAAMWWSLHRLARRCCGAPIPLVFSSVSLATGATIFLSDSFSLGQLGLSFGAAVAGAAFTILIAGRSLPARGAVDFCLVILFGFWLSGIFAPALTPTNAALLALAPLAAWAGQIPALVRSGRWKAEVVRFLAVGTPIAAALILAARELARSMRGPY